MRGSFRLHLILLLATAIAAPTLADTDPSLSEAYEAFLTGHLEQAQKTIDQVLRDDPKSAKAHYVAAEVDTAAGNFVQGRQDLRLAQELAPGVPFAAPESVRKLQDTLSQAPLHSPPVRGTGAGFPWYVLAIVVFWMGVVPLLVSMRRRARTDIHTQPRR